jgi:GntR family transcriptional regulator
LSVDPTDPRPPYQQVAAHLRAVIARGEIGPGDPLPSVRALADRFTVTTVTASRALDELRAEGLVDTRPGRGIFLRARRPVIRVGVYLTAEPDGQRATWAGEGERQGFAATQDITEVAVVTAPVDIATRLGLDEDARTVVRRRVLYADGVPVQLSDSYYPVDLAEGTELAEPRKLRGYTFAALQRLGVELDHFEDELHTRMPTPTEVRSLRLGKGTPVIRVIRTTYGTGGRPVEVTDQVLAGDRYILTYEVPAHRPG